MINQIEEFLRKCRGMKAGNLTPRWEARLKESPPKFIKDGKIIRESLENFRGRAIFVHDIQGEFKWYNPRNLTGGRRGAKRLLIETFEKFAYKGLLKKYPCSEVGNPHIFTYKGYKFTYRWLKILRLLGLLIDSKIKFYHPFDLGSSYGRFPYFLKKEFNRPVILLDFPEQLALARYFLGTNFPEARFSDCDVFGADINKDFIHKYDFILVPWFLYHKISDIDLVINVNSFGEMTPQWFKWYTESRPYAESKYVLLNNRFQSLPDFQTNITILDYHLERFKKLHFENSPLRHYYRRRGIFFYRKDIFSPSFEFIGERK